MSRHLAVFTAACSLALAASADPEFLLPGPFHVPREQFYPSLKVVAVAPLSLPRDLDDPGARRELQALIEGRLHDAGLEVVPARDVAVVAREVATASGGAYDRMTGKLDKAKAARIDEEVLRRLREELHADALLEPAVVRRYARLEGHRLEWDGVAEEGESHFWEELWVGHISGGHIPAVSLQVRLRGATGQPLYERFAGMKLMERVDGNQVVTVPRGDLLADHDVNIRAVHRALDELLVDPPTPSGAR